MNDILSQKGNCKTNENKRLYVGVSPYPYRGKSYWYIDDNGVTEAGSYVWVRMGRHDREQMVYVDCVRWFSEDEEPYPRAQTKKVLRQTTEEEQKKAEEFWSEFF